MAFHPPMLYLGYVGLHGAVRVRHRRPGHRPARRGLARSRPGGRPCSPGASSPSASSSAPGGATRCSGGAASGAGTRWRTRRSCPWLTGTAYLHSVMVQERRGMLRVWNLSLLCATFSLTILGTFLTRSGVLESVHAFSDSDIGAVAAVVLRAHRRGHPRPDRLAGRPAALARVDRLAGVARGRVPRQQRALRRVRLRGAARHRVPAAGRGAATTDRVTVGAPYFNRMTVPIGIALLFLMAVAPVLPWRKASEEVLAQRLLWPAWAGAIAMARRGGPRRPRRSAPCSTFGLGAFAGGLGRAPARARHPPAGLARAGRAAPTAG